ncbi:MAG: hypothetical protein GXX91_01550 [Verrucomicrobiaceae bacterium]|nr:hypothetical protein [Verrucomicrobiaceae bacterium]
MKPATFFFRTFLLSAFTMSLLGGAIFTDYYLRHEITRKAKRYLAAQGIELVPASAVTAAEQGNREHLVQLETAGVPLGEPDESGTTPLLAAAKNGHDGVIDFLITRESALTTLNHVTEPARETPLVIALRERRFALADRFLEKGATLEVDAEAGLPFLIAAVQGGDREMIDYLLRNKVEVDYKGTQPITALAVSANLGEIDLMKRFLEAKADPNTRGISGKPLLIEAVREGNREKLDLLLANEANVNATTGDGDGLRTTALSFAIAADNVPVQEVLLQRGATPGVHTLTGEPLLFAAVAARDHALAGRLLEQGAKGEVLSSSDISPLVAAVQNEDLEMVDLLLQHGVDPSFAAEETESPLFVAASNGNAAIASQLIAAGANLDTRTLLAESYQRRDDPLMSLLLHSGADPESTLPGTEERVFDTAVRDGATGAVRTLLAAGAKIGDNLWAALLTGQDELIRLILEAGADPRQTGPEGQDPLDYCLTHGRYGAARVLLNGGADPDARFDEEESWLSRAVRQGNTDIALALIESGATVEDTMAKDGHTLLGWAIANGMTEVAVALVKAGADPNSEERSPATVAFREKFDSTTFRYHLQVDSRIRPLMMAAAQKNHIVAQALMDGGAKGRAYSRKYLFAASIGAWFKDVKMQQIALLGKAPKMQPRKVVVDLSAQRVTLYENGVATYSTPCSTGRSG